MRHVASALSGAPDVASSSFHRPTGGATKRAFDIAAGLLATIIASPLFLACYLLVLASSGRPVLFRHRRIGFAGREFTCLKFRTMAPDAEKRLQQHLAANPDAAREWTNSQKLKNDPRVTRIGKIMRRTSLDELPQLFNVLKGEMSLVGPRPIVVEEIARYQEHFYVYAGSRPGITGLWQVKGRNKTTYAERVAFDVEYLQNWSVRRDVAIMLMTVKRVLEGRGAY
jgi:exopolysaccharide production protein ExoY